LKEDKIKNKIKFHKLFQIKINSNQKNGDQI
jgi:hypothetical protein